MKASLVSIAAALGLAFAAPTMAQSIKGAIGGGSISAGNIGGSQAGSGLIGGSALLGLSTGTFGTVATTNAATQSTLTLRPTGIEGTVLNQHTNSSISAMESASLGGALNTGITGGNAGSIGAGIANGGFLGLNINIQP